MNLLLQPIYKKKNQSDVDFSKEPVFLIEKQQPFQLNSKPQNQIIPPLKNPPS